MMLRELFADLFVRGLPILGAVAGGVHGARKAGKWWMPLAWAAGGWAGGWGASRLIEWGLDRMVPGLPENTVDLGEGATGYDPSTASQQVSGIRYVNLEAEKARARQEAVDKRRARRGRKVDAPTVVSPAPAISTAIVPVSQASKEENQTPANVVPLALRRGMMYSGLRVGKNVLGVSRPKSPGETGA